MVEELPDKERWLALLSCNECWLTKEDANGIADWIRSETTEVERLSYWKGKENEIMQREDEVSRLTTEVTNLRAVLQVAAPEALLILDNAALTAQVGHD